MTARENGKARELFESVSANHIRWAFVILPDDRWAITRDGLQVALGTVDRSSLRAGVEQFGALTHPPSEASACDPLVQSHLDRIESLIPLGASGQSRRRRGQHGRRCVK